MTFYAVTHKASGAFCADLCQPHLFVIMGEGNGHYEKQEIARPLDGCDVCEGRLVL